MQITYTSYKKDNSVYISIYLHGTTTQIGNFEVAKIDEYFGTLADGTFLKTGNNALNLENK